MPYILIENSHLQVPIQFGTTSHWHPCKTAPSTSKPVCLFIELLDEQNHAKSCSGNPPCMRKDLAMTDHTSWGLEDSMFIWSTLFNVHSFCAPICGLVCLPAVSHTLAITSKKPWYGIFPLSSALMSSISRTAGQQFLRPPCDTTS